MENHIYWKPFGPHMRTNWQKSDYGLVNEFKANYKTLVKNIYNSAIVITV